MISKIQKLQILLAFLFLPLLCLGQQNDYFPNRLLIKYDSPRQLQKIKAKSSTNPKTEVEQFLRKAGAQKLQPLLSSTARRTLRQKRAPQGQSLLQIQEVTFNRSIDPQKLAAKIERMPGVIYAEPKYIRRMSVTPDDPVLEKFIDFHNFTDGWNITTGNREVVIAIVDGGVGYNHPDLNDKLWINQSEIPAGIRPQVDQNADGSVTSTEIRQYLRNNGADYDGEGGIRLNDALHPNSPFTNQMDEDNNGYTDDLFGWDFWSSGNIVQATSDNNPIHDGTDHGTHVAGIAAAETDNNTAVAGAGFNSKYMAIKAGGTQQDPRAVGFGFEGIIYAANHGADIINCSWGGGNFSQAEQDVIEYATQQGSLVIAASGNQGSAQIDFPAAYDNVMGVGSVEQNRSAATYSNFGFKLDVLATGSGIESTSYNGQLATKTGTSMSTPVVSGLAALLKAIHPTWSPERISRQIRTSADPIDDSNPNHYQNKLGRGSINAFEALNTNNPGLKVASSQFTNEDGNKLQVGQPGTLIVKLVNVGATATGIELQLQSLINQGIDIDTPSKQLSTVATGDTAEVAFDLTINNNFDINRRPTLRLNFSNTNATYTDFGIIQYNRFLYDVVAANNIKTSFAADGTIGFTNPNSGTGGVGFIPRTQTNGDFEDGENLLFEGGLMILIDEQMYDAVRSENGQQSRDFIPQDIFTTTSTDAVSDLDGHASFQLLSDTTHNATVDLQTFAYDNPRLSNVIFVKYTLRNNSSFQLLKNAYVGLFNDWDIGNSANNNVSFSSADSLMYISEASSNDDRPVTAVAQMGPISGVLAIDNTIEGAQDSLAFGLYDGFTDDEKRRALRSQTVRTEVQNTDASAVIASGPYTLNPGAEITAGFIYTFGENPERLRDQIAEARSQAPFEVSAAGRALANNQPEETELFQNYPNPFGKKTQIRFNLNKSSHVTLTIYDVLGRKVRTLLNKDMEAASHFVDFDAQGLSSGVYFARLKTDQGVRTIPMTFIK